MPSYKNYDLVHVAAMIIPAGSIIDGNSTWSGIMVYGAGGQDETQMVDGDYFDETDGVFEEFTPPENWIYKHIVGENYWFKALQDCVVLDISAFGNGFGSVSCGLDYEIRNAGLMDTFHMDTSYSEFKNMADLAKEELAKHRLTPGYRYRRQYRNDEPIQPLDIEESQVHLVLVYNYTSVVDDYNHECDVYIEYMGQLDMTKINTVMVETDEA